MPQNVNCRWYEHNRKCLHPFAPQTFFGGRPNCIETNPYCDERLRKGCRFKDSYERPEPPSPPPAPAIRIVKSHGYD
jgi:hypothetical protein